MLEGKLEKQGWETVGTLYISWIKLQIEHSADLLFAYFMKGYHNRLIGIVPFLIYLDLALLIRFTIASAY